jgi:hypothetical protein
LQHQCLLIKPVNSRFNENTLDAYALSASFRNAETELEALDQTKTHRIGRARRENGKYKW